jgi:L-lysine exporter family protein LysE/ArgO
LAAAILHGFLLSLGLILPLGVQNTFVFTQGALQPRLQAALPVAVTAALCDTLLILLAVSGVSLAVMAFPWLHGAISWTGVAFLGYMGWATWRTPVSAEPAAVQHDWPFRRQVLFAVSVSLLNPHAILDTVGVIGPSSLPYTGAPLVAYTATCVLVSWLWFFSLAGAGRLVGAAGSRGGWHRWLSRISAFVMWSVGVQLLWRLLG